MHALLQNLTYRGLLSIINIVNNSFLLQYKVNSFTLHSEVTATRIARL